MDETKILPPSFPLTARINQAITSFYFDYFAKKYLPTYETRVTSTLREADHNASIGGADNSAHLHGLAVDFQLFRNGVRVPAAEENRVFEQVVKPNWPGFALNEIATKNHIHVNLTRQITITTGITTAAVLGILAVPVVKKLFASERRGK